MTSFLFSRTGPVGLIVLQQLLLMVLIDRCYGSSNVIDLKEKTTIIHQHHPHEQRQRHKLQQSQKWEINGPDVSYSGMQLNLDYDVGNHIREEDVSIDLFEDDDCTDLISSQDNDYVVIDIVNDLSPIGDGTNRRTMYVDLNINPTTVSQSPVITFNSVNVNGQSQAAVSFCVRLNVWDPDDEFNPEPAGTQDYIVAVSVDLTQNIGITGLISDQEELYGTIAYECDRNNVAVPFNETQMTKNQGDQIRICVEPDDFAKQYGAVMKSINSLSLVRGDVIQDVLVPQGVIQDFLNTEYECLPGQSVCVVECLISNDFYYSTGTVFVQGEALLQYAFDLGATVGDGKRQRRQLQSSSIPNQLSNHQQHHHVQDHTHQRRVREPGGNIGGRPFEFNFQVEPSVADYQAVAFECDSRNRPLESDALERLRIPGGQIRVCVMPDEKAIERGVYIRAIASFFLKQNDIVQFAVEPTGKQAADGNSLLVCYPGQPLCVFKTVMSDKFFDSWDPVIGTGEIYLQFGTELRPIISRNRRQQQEEQRELDLDDDHHLHREMQITDAGFAGAAAVSIRFSVDPTYVPPENTWQQNVNDWWVNTPLFLRIVYIIVLIIVVGILFCVMYGMFCGWDMVRKGGKSDEDKDPQVIVQPIFIDDDQQQTEYDFCDCLSNPDDYYYDPEEAPQQGQPYESVRGTKGFSVPGSVYCDDDSTLPSRYPDEMEQSPRIANQAYVDETGSVRSPRRSKKKSTSKSPKSKRKNVVDDDGIRISNHGAKSPKSTKSNLAYENDEDDMARRSPSNNGSKSPKKRKKKKSGDGDDASARSPRPGGKRSSSVPMDMGSEKTPKSKKKSTKSGKTPKSAKTPKKSPKSSKKKKETQSIDPLPF